jgi:hypothetical protein
MRRRVVWKALLRLMAMMASQRSTGKSRCARHVLDAGVVDQDVDAAELGGSVGHHGLDLGRLAHVGAVVPHLDARAATSARALHVAKAVEHDVGALAGQRLGNAQADAAGGAGDECGFAFEHARPAPHGLLGMGRAGQRPRGGLRARPDAPGARLRHAGASTGRALPRRLPRRGGPWRERLAGRPDPATPCRSTWPTWSRCWRV